MPRIRFHLLFPALLAMMAAIAVFAREPAENPRDGVLVLRNGDVVVGQVTANEKHYLVSDDHGKSRYRREDVEIVATDMADAYQQKRQQSERPTADSHILMARWCLRHALYDEAEQELNSAREIEPDHVQIELMAERIAAARSRHGKTPAAKRPPEPEESKKLEGDSTIPQSVPEFAVRSFTRTIQPTLLNQCGTGACHGPRSKTELVFERVEPGKSLRQRLTQKNLAMLLKYVDWDNPDNSAALKHAITPHGGSTRAPLGSLASTKYRTLRAWVYIASGNLARSEEYEADDLADDQADDPRDENSLAENRRGKRASSKKRAARVSPRESKGDIDLVAGEEELLDDGSPESLGKKNHRTADENEFSDDDAKELDAEELIGQEPNPDDSEDEVGGKDPFDPEVFNRQYSPRNGNAPRRD